MSGIRLSKTPKTGRRPNQKSRGGEDTMKIGLICKKSEWLAAVCVAGLLLSAPSFAQRGGGGGGRGGDQGGQGRGAAITDPKEAAAYQAFVAAKGDKKIQLGNDFTTNYPKSIAAPVVAEQVVSLDFQKQDWPAFYAACDKLFTIKPDAASTLAQDAWVIARNFKEGQTSPTLEQAETNAKHALDLLSTMQKPDALTDDQFAKAKAVSASQAHSALGLIYGREQKPEDAAAQLEQVTDPDGTDVYLLGASYEMIGKHVEATQEFKKCGSMSGVLQQSCSQNAAQTAKEGADAPASK
jgi:hypothetical protein